MKLLKRDIKIFIEKVENKAVKSIRKKFDLIVFEYLEANYGEIVGDIKFYAPQLENIINSLAPLIEKADGYSPSTKVIHYLNNTLYQLNSVSVSDFKNEDDNIKKLRVMMGEEVEQVKQEYEKIYHYLKVNSAKETYNYLIQLGFDVSSIPTGNNVPTITNIDKSKLFVCGDNK